MFHNSQSNANSDDKLIFQRILKLNLTFRMLINIHFQERPLWIPNQAPGITLVNYYHLSFRSQLPLVLSVLGKLCGLLQVKVLGVKLCLWSSSSWMWDHLSSFYPLVSIREHFWSCQCFLYGARDRFSHLDSHVLVLCKFKELVVWDVSWPNDIQGCKL